MKRTVLPRKYTLADVQQNYAQVVRFYDLWSRLTESKATRLALQIARIRDGETVLEVAVGTGLVFEEIVRQNPNGRSAGIDLSPAMLSKAKNRLQRYVGRSFHLQHGSAYRLPFADNVFDLLVNNYLFDLLPEADFEAILSEFNRVLKPSGRMVITTFSFGTRWYHRVWFWVARRFPTLLAGCRPIAMDRYVTHADFQDIGVEAISHNTFPSTVLWMKKRAARLDEAGT